MLIRTYYLGPTNTRGPRMSAVGGRTRPIQIPYDHGLDERGNHHAVVLAWGQKYQLQSRVTCYGSVARSGGPKLQMIWVSDDSHSVTIGPI